MVSNVQVLPGADGILQAYRESMVQAELDIICLSSQYERVIGNFFDKTFAPNVYGKVRTREIVPDTAGNRASAEAKSQSVNATRFLKGASSESDLLLWQDQAVFISFGTQPAAIRITDPEIVKSLHLQFNSLWDSLN